MIHIVLMKVLLISILNNWNILTSDLSFATPNTRQSSSIESVNTPRKSINNISETPNLPQKDINSKESNRRIM